MVEERMGDCWSHTKVWFIFNMTPALLSGSSHVTICNYQMGRVYVCVCSCTEFQDVTSANKRLIFSSQVRNKS